MIIYDLECKNGHRFEGWFSGNSAFEEQRAQKLVTCPVCGDFNTERILSPITYTVGEGCQSCNERHERNIAVKGHSVIP